MKKSLHLFTMMDAHTDLSSGSHIYEANTNLTCAGCGATIPINTYFGRKHIAGTTKPIQHCRTCVPFHIYTGVSKERVVPVERESEYVRKMDDVMRGKA